ncbi:MAG TPA: beta galactosidase jelly roll domain-containing protein, partial [Draconibacterium sp.]|nr:beta galactosidase jelly roll domain-containing protein [Draconibacterium sp.]
MPLTLYSGNPLNAFNLFVAGFVLVSLTIFQTAAAQVGFGQAEKINQNWKFILHDIENGEKTDLSDQSWKTVDLPHDWSVKQQLSPTLASATGYLPGGVGWYRKQLFISKDNEDKKVYLYFEGVYNHSEVFVNGQSIGKRPNGYISFMYDATSQIKYGVENLIAVRVDHSQSADSRWYTGSGIYRNVWVVYANPVHIAQWGVFAHPEKQKKGYNLNLEVEVENDLDESSALTVTNELYDDNNFLAAKSSDKI